VFLTDEVSIIFATAIPFGHVTSVCVDTDLVDSTTDAYVNPGCPVETELDCCEYISFASLKETLRSVLIQTIACRLFHSGHCLEYAGRSPEQFAHFGCSSGQSVSLWPSRPQ
jgi:hypothetical protein